MKTHAYSLVYDGNFYIILDGSIKAISANREDANDLFDYYKKAYEGTLDLIIGDYVLREAKRGVELDPPSAAETDQKHPSEAL